jgi:hypothetical protein
MRATGAGRARPRGKDRSVMIDLLRNVVAAVARFFAPRAVVAALLGTDSRFLQRTAVFSLAYSACCLSIGPEHVCTRPETSAFDRERR